MATSRAQADDEAVVQLAVRIPATLLHRVKIFCVRHDVTVMAFVAEALREKLKRTGTRPT
jgi:hypothetical protein